MNCRVVTALKKTELSTTCLFQSWMTDSRVSTDVPKCSVCRGLIYPRLLLSGRLMRAFFYGAKAA